MKILYNNIFNKIPLIRKIIKKASKDIIPEIKTQAITADCFEPTGIFEYQKCGFREIGNHNLCIHPLEYTVDGRNKTYALPEYFITLIKADTLGLGYGTKVIKNILRKSLVDPSTKGRVCLYADAITKNKNNEMVYPAGFYFKLGFRFAIPEYNKILKHWLKNGGKKETAPKIHGLMYMPKKNISYCLNH